MMRKTLALALLLLVPGLASAGGVAQQNEAPKPPRAGLQAKSNLASNPVGALRRGLVGRSNKWRPSQLDQRTGNDLAEARREREQLARIRVQAGKQKREKQFRYKPLDTRAQQAKVLSEPLEQAPFKADYIDIGMGPTGMMTMLAAVASGKTAVGVEMRGAPQRGVHQNIRVDWFHTLKRIDDMMLARYGEAGIPKLPNGKPFILHDYFYNHDRVGGHLDFHEIHGVGDDIVQNVAGRLDRISFEDDREATRADNGGKGKLFVLPAPAIPAKADASKLDSDMKHVLDSPSTFQAALSNYEQMLRAYIHAMEKQDASAGRPPRIKTYENHRVAQEDGLAAGYINARGGKNRIVIEEIVDDRAGGSANRVRKPGSRRIDLGVPTRWTLTAGFGGGADAKTMGYEQEDVSYHDPVTGETVVAKQNWLVGEVTANVGGQLIRRISTYTDPKTGKKQTIRQIAVGHEKAPNIAWVPVQVPDFMTFDPIEAGKVPAGTDPKSQAYKDAAQALIKDYFIEQVAAITHLPQEDIRKMRMFYGPNFFTLREKLGKTARLSANGNVAGDLMGNGHFLTSGGAMTGMIGHANRYVTYWDQIARGVPERVAARELEAGIKTDSEAWLHVSIKEFFDVSPVNFGADRAKAIGIKGDNAPVADAKAGANHGLAGVLGSQQWSKAISDLRAGKYGKAHVDFYVPPAEVDVKAASHVTVHHIGADGKPVAK